MGYPDNVSVHGNGFVQIELGGRSRLHIWSRGLPQLCQTADSRWHNHRFGFVSTVLRGALKNRSASFEASPIRGGWSKWDVADDRFLPSPFRFRKYEDDPSVLGEGQTYQWYAGDTHRSVPLDEFVVTLMTKTAIIDGNVYVFTRGDTEPDYDYDRRKVPWELLRDQHILPALTETPFQAVPLW